MSKELAAKELDTLIESELFEAFLRDPIEADLDSGWTFAKKENGLLKLWICAMDEDGNVLEDSILVERWIAVLEDPTAIDRPIER